MFHDDQQFWFETLRNLGLATYGGSDVGEVVATASRVVPGDYHRLSSRGGKRAWRQGISRRDPQPADVSNAALQAPADRFAPRWNTLCSCCMPCIRRPREAAALIFGLLLTIGGITWWLLADGTRGAEIATVLALPVAAIGIISTVVGGSKALRKPGEVTRPWICLTCGKQLRARVAPGEVGVGPCPRCGTMGTVQLLPSGRVRVTTNAHETPIKEQATYRARPYLGGLTYYISDFKKSEFNEDER
jgi:hypothetical protein